MTPNVICTTRIAARFLQETETYSSETGIGRGTDALIEETQ
jgi:hypothetical protein